MLNCLPRELENNILHFLIMPRDVSTIVCVSKKCKYKMKNLAFFREKEMSENYEISCYTLLTLMINW